MQELLASSSEEQLALNRPEEIARLIRRQFQPRDVTVKMDWRQGQLRVLLEGQTVPDLEPMVANIQQALIGVKSDTVKWIKVYGRQIGQKLPAWQAEIELDPVSDATHQALSFFSWMHQGQKVAGTATVPSPTPSAVAPPAHSVHFQSAKTESLQRFLRFRLHSGKTALLPLEGVKEVIAVPPSLVLPVPQMPEAVLGVYNYRGQILWLVDLEQRIGIYGSRETKPQLLNVVTVEVDHKPLGLVVFQIDDIEIYPADQIQTVSTDLFPIRMMPFLCGYLPISSSPIVQLSALFF